MPIKKKEEVCGKPNQYNLQTLEYDWKELPDSHIQVPQQQPRIRNYSVAAAPPSNARGAARGGQRLNPITHQPLPSAELAAPTAAVVPSYTPLPSPSKPRQEEARYGANRRDNVADLFAATPPASPAYAAPAAPSSLQPAPAPRSPYALAGRAADVSPGRAPPALHLPAGYNDGHNEAAPFMRQEGPAVIPWSHDDIRRAVTSNALEAQRSYLR